MILLDIIDLAYDKIKGKALLLPMAIAAIVSAAAQVGGKIIEDAKAKNAAKQLDKEKEAAKAEEKKLANEQVEAAKGIVKAGDPTLAEKQRLIKQGGANTIGKAVASSKSTQEIIKAAGATQVNVDNANNAALSTAGEFNIKAQNLLADRFAAAGRQRLIGNNIINQESQAALDAIGANSQATVDSIQSVGSVFTQAAGLGAFDKKKKVQLKEFSL